MSFEHCDYHLIAIAKGWVKDDDGEKLRLYPKVIDSIIEAYKKEYCDLTGKPILMAREMVERWLIKHGDLFNMMEFVKHLDPNRNWYLGYPQTFDDNARRSALCTYDAAYDAGYWGNWLRAILSQISVMEISKFPGFREWLDANGYDTNYKGQRSAQGDY